MKATTSGPLPLVVGVTGHRDICPKHVPELRTAIAEALKALRGPSNVPLVVLSALAKGSDRLVADVALKMGCDLVAVLPMRKEDYEENFLQLGEGPESVQEFNTILGLARNWYVVESDNVERDTIYGGAARNIALSSHVLLALWDGNETESPGGTTFVVSRVLGRNRSTAPGAWPHGPVYQISVHRSDKCPPQFSGFHSEWLPPREPGKGEANLREFARYVCNRVRTYNRDVIKVYPDFGTLGLEEHYRMADALAIKYSRLMGRAFFIIYVLVGLAAGFAIFAHSEEYYPLYLGLYAGFLGLAFIGYVLARILDFQNKAQDYRALAEGLRVACGWRLIGIREFVSQRYLVRMSDEGRWIRNALAAFECTTASELDPAHEPGNPSALWATIKGWLRPELQYYVGASARSHSLAEWSERVAIGFLIVSVLLALSLFARQFPATFLGRFATDYFDGISTSSTVCAVIAALTHDFIEKRAWREHTRRYSRMAKLLNETIEWIDLRFEREEDSKISVDEIVHVLRAVGQEELDENGERLQAHRARPLEIPHTG